VEEEIWSKESKKKIPILEAFNRIDYCYKVHIYIEINLLSYFASRKLV